MRLDFYFYFYFFFVLDRKLQCRFDRTGSPAEEPVRTFLTVQFKKV